MEMLTEKGVEFKEYEQHCFNIGMQFAREIMSEALKKIDEELMKQRNTYHLRHKGLRPLTIKTLMGEVTVPRRMYKYTMESGKAGYIYLLDEAIGLDTIGNISIGLVLRMAEEVTESSYRSSATSISSMTGQTISHTGLWNAIQGLGEKIEVMDTNRSEAVRNFTYPGDKSTPVLMEEYDGVWLNMQGKDRPKSGKQVEMKVSVTYEGTEVSGYDKEDNELYRRINPLFMVGFESTTDFFDKKEGQLASVYNLDEVTDRLINGDGADWIKTCEEKTGGNTYFQLDQFHIKKKQTETGFPKELRRGLNILLSSHRIETALAYIDYMVKTEPNKDKRKKLNDLYTYYNNHRDYLIPIRYRNLDELKEYENIRNSNMGTVENAVGSVISLRMKKRRASFTKAGATTLGRLLSLKRSGLLNQVVSMHSAMTVPIEYEKVIIEPLTAARAPRRDGKGFNYPYKGGTPFDGQFTTNGRKAVKKMLGYRSYSELVYR